jgi:hypothetical protein
MFFTSEIRMGHMPVHTVSTSVFTQMSATKAPFWLNRNPITDSALLVPWTAKSEPPTTVATTIATTDLFSLMFIVPFLSDHVRA